MLDGKSLLGGIHYTVLDSEAMPSVAAAAQIFKNAPVGTKEIMISLRTQGITVTFDGTTPTAAAVGNDISTGTYTLQINRDQALLVKAIQQAATATGFITYFGVE